MVVSGRIKLALTAAAALALLSGVVAAQDGGQPPAESAPAAGEGADKPAEPRPPSTGYSWSDKPKPKRARRWKPQPIDPNKPLATYPGFRMLPDGRSQIWLRVSKKVAVTMRQAAGRTSFVLPEVQVGVKNNTNPLVTTHFDTPVALARLTRAKDGAVLVVELREPVSLTHRIIDGPRGSAVVLVEVPKAQKRYSRSAPPARAASAPAARARPGATRTLPSATGPKP